MKIYPHIQELGAEVLVISFTKPSRVANYVAKYPLPFPALSDPERNGYNAFALGSTRWWTYCRPGVILRYLKLMLCGWWPGKIKLGDDFLQLGGDFVLDEKRRLVYAYPSSDPTDRPSSEELLAAVRRATEDQMAARE